MGCLQNTLFCLHTPGTVWLSLPHLKSNWDIKQGKKCCGRRLACLISLVHSLEHENWYFLLCKLSISRRSICIRGGSLPAVSLVLVVFLLKSSTCGYCAPHWRTSPLLPDRYRLLLIRHSFLYIVSVFPPACSFPSSAFQFVLFCFPASQDFI